MYQYRKLRLIILLGVAGIILYSSTWLQEAYTGIPYTALTASYQKNMVSSTLSYKAKEPESEIAVVPGFFNTTYLLDQLAKELETDGWIAPHGVGGIARRLSKLKDALRRKNLYNTPATMTKKPSEHVLYEFDRWKVNYIGCFHSDRNFPLLQPYVSKMEVTSVTDCVLKCDMEGFSYVALSSGKLCTCGKTIATRLLVSERSRPTDDCNVSCKADVDSRPCGGMDSSSIYKINIHRKAKLTLSDIHRMTEGCFIKPKNFENVFTNKATFSNGSAAHCLSLCEKLWEPIAAWDSQSGECMCGKYEKRLSVQRLQKSPNNGLCDKKYCNSMNKCKVRYLTSIRTYAYDERCDSRTFLPQRTNITCALASFPGSGNTWVRYLIESATGIYTGSMYNDRTLNEQGFLGELLPWDSRRTSVVKTHDGSWGSARHFNAAVVLIRNPYDAFLAEFNRVAGGHTGFADPQFFKIKEWDFFVTSKLTKWLSVISYFSELKRVHVVFFEDIISNPIEEVRRICQFLGIFIPNLDERLQCLISSLGGDFKRAKRKLGFDPFTSAMKRNVNLFVEKGREILEKKGLARLPHYERL